MGEGQGRQAGEGGGEEEGVGAGGIFDTLAGRTAICTRGTRALVPTKMYQVLTASKGSESR